LAVPWKNGSETAVSDDDIDCSDAVHTLYHFLDGELTPDRLAHIQHHLEACQPCLEKFDFEAELRLVIARKCRDQVPESLRVRIVESIRMEARITTSGPLEIPE
jgi:mycothiol system anti-sigma-R factor